MELGGGITMKAQYLVKLCFLIVAGFLPVAGLAQRPHTSCDTTRNHTLYSWQAAVFGDALKSPDGNKVLKMERTESTTNDNYDSIR